MLRNLLSLLLVLVVSLSGYTQKVVKLEDVDKRVVIRNQMHEEGVFAVPRDVNEIVINRLEDGKIIEYKFTSESLNQSVGTPLGSLTNLDSQLEKMVESGQSLEAFRKSYIYITGFGLSSKKRKIAEVREIFKKNGIDPDKYEIYFKYMEVPYHLIEQGGKNIFRSVASRFIDFFPSVSRDFEKPMLKEVMAGFSATTLVELPMALWLFKNPMLEKVFGPANISHDNAVTIITIHTAILLAYTAFSKFIGNWVTRNGNSKKFAIFAKQFTKQTLLSLPFIANFEFSSNATEHFSIWKEIFNRNLAESGSRLQSTMYATGEFSVDMLTRLPANTVEFLLQGTPYIQTLFYTIMMANGFYAWRGAQQGLNSQRARTAMHYFAFPFLAMDSLALLAASSGTLPVLYEIGFTKINSGHFGIAGLTILGGLLFFGSEKLIENLNTLGKTLKPTKLKDKPLGEFYIPFSPISSQRNDRPMNWVFGKYIDLMNTKFFTQFRDILKYARDEILIKSHRFGFGESKVSYNLIKTDETQSCRKRF